MRHVPLAACHLKGIEVELRCGHLTVAEDRAKTDKKDAHLDVWFAVMPAIARTAVLDPVIVLAGGPGQSDSSVAGLVMPLFAKLNRNRDIVFIDQRGTGHSSPLNCPPPKGATSLASQLDPALVLDSLDACARGFRDRGIDVTHYLTTDAAMDIDEVRRALGYGQINLWAASYGTRLALEYLRLYPTQLRSAVLDGPNPSNMQLPLSAAVDTDRALDAILKGCAAEARCARAHPNLSNDLDVLFAKLKANPLQLTLTDPLTGTASALKLTPDTFAAWVRQPLYSPVTASLVPEAIVKASGGDLGPLAALNLAVTGDVIDELSLGMHLSVVCSEDMAAVKPEQLKALASSRFGTAFYDLYHDMCAHWPSRSLPDAFFALPHADAPVLILAGGLDPATPPVHGEVLLPGLPNGHLLIAPNLGHGISEQACAPELIDQFVRHPDKSKLDGNCLAMLPMPTFFEPLLGREPK